MAQTSVASLSLVLLVSFAASAFVLPRSRRIGCDRLPTTCLRSVGPDTTGRSCATDVFTDAVRRMELSSTDDVRRIFHGRGGCFPGYEHITLDWFPPVLLLTSFKDLSDSDIDAYCDFLETRWKECFSSSVDANDEADFYGRINLVYQCRADSPAATRLVAGNVPEKHVVTENGDKHYVNLRKGQNHGLFLDMARGRAWVKTNARNCSVLNMFAYTCAFSIAALNGGASEVINIDMAKGALKTGQRNHELNEIEPGRSRFLGHDVFKSWGKLKKAGPFDIVVADPPSYQKGSFVAKKDYEKLIRRLPQLLRPRGKALICLNAPELDTNFLSSMAASEAPELRCLGRLENPETFPAADSNRALKVFVYELPEY